MKWSSVLIALAATVSVASGFVSGPQATRWTRAASKVTVPQASSVVEAAPCDMPDIAPGTVSAKQLKTATVTNADGELVRLGDVMGNGKSVVVFLRHLG